MKKNGMTLIETLISISVMGIFSIGVLSKISESMKKEKTDTFIQESYSIIKAIDHRIAIDGYDPILWNKSSWSDFDDISEDLINKKLTSQFSDHCDGGEWEPSINSEHKTKLLDCKMWENKNYDEFNFNAVLNTDSSGYLNTFDLFISFKTLESFKSEFQNINNSINKINGNKYQEIAGIHTIEYNSITSKNIITTQECITDALDCEIKMSFDRSGGNEYIRADGANSMIGEHLTFIESKGDAPMKCVRWTNSQRDGSGAWTIEPIDDCGVGIYKKTPYPVVVDVVADTGTFKNILLDQSCKIFKWNNTTKEVEDTMTSSPCGTLNDSGEIVQVVENIRSENAEIFNLKATDATIQNIAISNIVADDIVSKFVTIENKLKVDIIESYNNSEIEFNNDLLSNENFTIKKLLTAKDINVTNDLNVSNNVNINNNLNANSGTINYFNSTSIIGTDATLNNNLNVKNNLTVDGDTSLYLVNVFGNATFKSTSKFENNATFNKRIVSNDYLQFNKVASENGGCSPNGLLSRTSSGEVLSCVNGKWSKASSSPSVRQVYGNSTAYRWPSKTVNCSSSEVVVGGGVQCDSLGGVGYLRMPSNRPNGNGWYGRCDTDKGQNVKIHVYAICLKK